MRVFLHGTSFLSTLLVFTVKFWLLSTLSAETQTGSNNCHGSFDLYFVLDSSRTVGNHNFQVQTVDFVQKMADHFISPKTRISFITFSMKAKIILALTEDEQKIKNGTERLEKVNADGGGTFVHYGFEKVNEQIRKFGLRTASIVIVITDGAFHMKSTAIKKAGISKELGATVYVIGVSKYKIQDLGSVASKPVDDHVFQSNSYDTLNKLIASIVNDACIEITRAIPSQVCANASFSIKLYGRGFTKTSNISTVSCSFVLLNSHIVVSKPSHITDDVLHCPAPTLNNKNSSAVLQVSVNGKSFVSSNVTITLKNCTFRKVSWIPTFVGVLFFLLLLLLLLCWWFWKLLPCAAQPKEKACDPPKKKKWKTVDASYYGGGGVGGVKPVRVQWGDKGATEAGKKLTNTPDAKILESESSEEEKKAKSFGANLRFHRNVMKPGIS